MSDTKIAEAPAQAPAANLAIRSEILPQASEKVRIEKLNSQSRKDFERSIIRRTKSMTDALNGSIGGDVDDIIQDLRLKSGLIYTEGQLITMIKGCDEQIRGTVEQYLGPERRAVESELELLNDEYNLKESEMKERHKLEWNALGKERKEKAEVLHERRASAEERIRAEHTPGMTAKKSGYQLELTRVREVEARITTEADQQVKLIKTRKSQLKGLVDDASARALERLLMVETRDEANQLVSYIPTVQEALALSKTARGLAILMNRLDPTLPVPEEAVFEVSKADDHVVDAEISDELDEDEVDDDEDEDEDEDHGEHRGGRRHEDISDELNDDSREASHDEIYVDNSVS